MLKHTIITLTLTVAAITGTASAQSVLNVQESLNDSKIAMPESAETAERELRHNWYLRNYAQCDTMAQFYGEDIDYPDEVIIDRLQKLPTSIELPFNSLVRKSIYFYTGKRREQVSNMIALGHYYMPIFEEALERNAMPLELKYLPVIESALNPNAVSRAGAGGLWQFMPGTATGEGLEVSSLVDQRRDPILASEHAAKYLKTLFNIYGDWSLAIAAYNCGPGNVNKAIRRAGGGKRDFWEIYPFLPAETRGYVPAFIAACYVMNYYADHNIRPGLIRRPLITDSVHVNKRVHFQQIADVLQIPIDEIRLLNPQYRMDVIPGNVHPYTLILPSKQIYAYILSEDSIVKHKADLYNPRAVVNPSDGSTVVTSVDGDYIITEKVIEHKVKRGETLKSIASRYGVTVASLRSANNGIRKVQKGQTISVVTRQKTRRPIVETSSEEETVFDENTAMTDSVTIPGDTVVIVSNDMLEKPEIKKPEEKKPDVKKPDKKVETKQKEKNKEKAEKPVMYTVRKGDNLGKIAARHNTTVAKLKKLNGLKNDNIQVGQKLRVK
ncbi:MAG: transglycosylase SLT domain-containing protein [Muribaculaceae bacterium]|nr:transglycosylase SLT domain-containing protein [Muribaculaceae bacterium]